MNDFYLMLPVLAWNGLLGPKMNQAVFTSDAHIPKWLFWVENALRWFVFMTPLFLPMRLSGVGHATPMLGWGLYGLGLLVYFSAWLPHLLSWSWRHSRPILLAPAYTPLIFLGGISILAGSWPYFILSCLFISCHVSHIAVTAAEIPLNSL